ncbi:MAG: hypothetical protein BGO48_16885 [Mucilaginibacter sp. 44-25]|nr:MAG: hypothetical protein BGO48_16885 [Mucilaginibacter sp. 44-25]
MAGVPCGTLLEAITERFWDAAFQAIKDDFAVLKTRKPDYLVGLLCILTLDSNSPDSFKCI